MTSNEAKKKLCPINSHPMYDGMCCGNGCILWVDFDNGHGNCSKRLTLDVLEDINNNRN